MPKMRGVWITVLLGFTLCAQLSATADYTRLHSRCTFALGRLPSESSDLNFHETKGNILDRWAQPSRSGKVLHLSAQQRTESNLPLTTAKGDTLEFDDGTRFELSGYYGSGGDVDVFRTTYQKQPVALRVGQYKFDGETYRPSDGREFIRGVALYKETGIRTVDVIAHDPKGQWVAVSPIYKKFELGQILNPSELAKLKTKFGAEELSQATKKLTPFLRSLRKVAYLHDFGAFQVAWDGQNWTVLDPSAPVILLNSKTLIENPALILKGPINPAFGKEFYNQFMHERLRNLKKDFPEAYGPVMKFLRDQISGSDPLHVDVDLAP